MEQLNQDPTTTAGKLVAGLFLGLAAGAALLAAPFAHADQCEKRKLDESSKYVSCMLKEASRAAKDETIASYEKCGSVFSRKEGSLARTCGEDSQPTLGEIGAFLGATTSALVEGVTTSAETFPALGGRPDGPVEGYSARVRLKCGFTPKVEYEPEPCMLEVNGVQVSCDKCTFELQHDEDCYLQKVLTKAEECRIYDDAGIDIPVVQEP